MKKVIYFSLITSLLLVFSCRTDKPQKLNNIPIFDLKSENFRPASIRTVVLERTDSCLLSDKLKLIQLNSSDIYLGDLSKENKKIFRFSDKGKFKNSIGQWGRGAQEYDEFDDFTVFADTVSILSFNGKYAEIFNYLKTGKFISKVHINKGVTSFTRIGSNYLFFIGNRPDLCSHQLYLTDLRGKTKASFLPYKGKACSRMGGHLNFERIGSTVLYKELFDKCVYKYENEKVYKTYEFDFGKYAIPKSYYEGQNSISFISEFAKMQKNGYGGISGYFETPKYIIFQGFVEWGFGDSYQIEYIIINKKTQKIKRYSYTSDKKFLGNLVGVNQNNELIFKVNAADILENKNKYEKLPITDREKLQNLKASDNPVLFYCTLKEN